MTRTYIFTAILCLAFFPNVFGQEAIQDDVATETITPVTLPAEIPVTIPDAIPEQPIREQTAPGVTLMSYANPRTFVIGGITVEGVTSLDPRSIMLLSGLEMGERITIPGDRISSAIDRLWRHGLFGNIEIYATHIIENRIYLVIEMEELPRINSFEITGIRRFEANKLRDELEIKPNDIITENRLNRLRVRGINYFREKGFLNANITAIQRFDTLSGGINLTFEVDRGPRVKISEIEIIGNEALRVDDPDESFRALRQAWRWTFNTSDLAFSDARIRRNLKNTKQRNVFRFWKRSKFVEPDFREDIRTLTSAYNSRGFRDFRVVHDSLTVISDDRVKLTLHVSEGNTYFFGDINFVGNTRYPDEFLRQVLNIQRGDIFDEEKLFRNIQFNPQQGDISSLYTDIGYLAFHAVPVEVRVVNDTVDIEIRMREGRQSRINRVDISGNTRTNDHVIIRELRVFPGRLFSRSDLINSMNELRMMRYFDPESTVPNVLPNADGTADISFTVTEVGSDQVELSGGWGGGMIVGTLGFAFNNFSIQNIFRRDRWRPLPSGDGQRLTIRGQTNGSAFHSVSVSFTEPWFGGRRPYALSISAYSTMQSNGWSRGSEMRGQVVTNGVTLGLGQRLRRPDPWFTLYQAFNYQHYNVHNFIRAFPVEDGTYHNFSYIISLGRQQLDGAIFPRNGSDINFSFQATPPYSLLGMNSYLSMNEVGRDTLSARERDNKEFRWLEYYKWNFRANWFMNPIGNLVVTSRVRFGAIGRWNNDIRHTPFERFKLGGDGMAMFSFAGVEVIGMRGYTNESLSSGTGDLAFNRLTFEVRYPVTLNPSATIYALAFVEAGNTWANPRQINPFQNYRSAGVGVRLFLAAMGMFGLDWGYGFDPVPGNPSASGSQFHFSINQSLD